MSSAGATQELCTPTPAQALRFWALLGWISFGGPAGQIALMHRELVGRRRWVDERTFVDALNYCMLLPGPEAMQLATFLGWRLHGVRGGLAAGALFVLPGALLLALLAWLYLAHGQLPLVQGAVQGLSAAALALVVLALVRLGRRLLRGAWPLLLAAAAFLLAAFALVGFPWIVLMAAAAGAILGRLVPGALSGMKEAPAPRVAGTPAASWRRSLRLAAALLLAWWLPLLAVLLALGPDSTSWAMAVFFSKAAVVTFGGAYAVLPYVAQQAVECHQWLSASQMVAGLGLAETTPGPLILVLEYVGFLGGWNHPDLASPLASALLGAAVSVWATFLPSFLFILPMAPWIERLQQLPLLANALSGVAAAVVGLIASFGLWFAIHFFAGATAGQAGWLAAMAALALAALSRERWPVPWVLLAAAALGGAWSHAWA